MKPLFDISGVPKKSRIGNKAYSLRKIKRRKFPVPRTFVIPSEVQGIFRRDPEYIEGILRKDIETRLDPSVSFAVRSSGEMEDHSSYSFAGQYTTLLNVSGADAILEGMKKVWNSSGSVERGPYGKKAGNQKDPSGMGVIIQEMVNAAWSGVAFSINPVTGRNEMIIEGVKGSGESLVQEGKTPHRWVHHQGTWDPFDANDSPGMDILDELVRGVMKLKKIFRTEIDMEWAWDGNQIWYLQCRPVTARQFPTIYSNHISREVLPGMIKPLVWSVNIPLVNSAWIRLLCEILGPLDIKPEQLSHSFYYRAYFNMGTLGALFRLMGLPGDSLESLMGRKDPSGKSAFKPGLKTMRYLPGMLRFMMSNINLGSRFRKKIRELTLKTDVIKKRMEAFTPDSYGSCFNDIREHAGEAAYYNIIIPLAMQITNGLLKRKIEKKGSSFIHLDFSGDFPQLKEYDPQFGIKHLQETWGSIPDAVQEKIKKHKDLNEFASQSSVENFLHELNIFLGKFGHFSESGNDFSYVPWREDPDFVLDLIRNKGIETGPEEEKDRERDPEQPVGANGSAYRRAGQYRIYREMISTEYTRCYGLFRELYLKTGEYLKGKGFLDRPEDVFLLSLEEHDRLLAHGNDEPARQLKEKVRQVRQEMASYENISLPSVIYGEVPPPLPDEHKNVMKGIPASPGLFRGKIIVVKGYKDFNKDIDNSILVIPFSDVGWTPILVRAGAIVSESGGMLSHASIVARELSIPAIASVDHACNLRDGSMARLDGLNGILILED